MKRLIPIMLLPKVALNKLHQLPSKPGVYYAKSWFGFGPLLYIGKSNNMRNRWSPSSWGEHHKYRDLLKFRYVRIFYHVLTNDSEAIHQETSEIRRYVRTNHRLPMLNRKLENSTVLRHSIKDWGVDSLVLGIFGFILYLININLLLIGFIAFLTITILMDVANARKRKRN